MKTYLLFWKAMIGEVLRGSRLYWAWILGLLLIIVAGLGAYSEQLQKGLIVTHMTDPVSWGAYIANFTYIVGLAAAAIMLVIPAYVYKIRAMKEIVLIGELFAVASVVMCILFVVVDLGRPDRMWHLFPIIGRINWPISMLTWDVLVLSGYLLLNLHIPGYLLYKSFKGEKPLAALYLPFIFTSIVWAVSIHTVTAFLYNGLGGRPYWNAAIVAPRFIASAFAVGPCFIILALQAIRRTMHFEFDSSVFLILKRIVSVAMIVNLFLLGSELFKEFYTDSAHTDSATYLFFGLRGFHMLVPYIWTAVIFNVAATLLFISRSFDRHPGAINLACILAILGIWIEKGMGLIVPGFIPSPLGDMVEYFPSFVEIRVSAGIWAIGALIFTLFVKAALPIESGRLTLMRKISQT